MNPSEHFTTSTPEDSSGKASPVASVSSASVTNTPLSKDEASGCHDDHATSNPHNPYHPPYATPNPPIAPLTTTLVNLLVSAGLIPRRLEDLQVPQCKLGGQ